MDTDTLKQIKYEDKRQFRAMEKAILNAKISPTKKGVLWKELCFPIYPQDDSYLLGKIF